MALFKRPLLLLVVVAVYFLSMSGVAVLGMGGMMGGGGGSSSGVMQLLAVGLIAKLLQDMKISPKMGQSHTTKIIPMPVYLGGGGGMMGNDWMMNGMMGGMMGGMMD